MTELNETEATAIPETNALVTYHERGGVLRVSDVTDHVKFIHEIMAKVMRADVHYGKIQGCGDKPTLYQAGADILAMTFGLHPEYETVETPLDGDHLLIKATCRVRTAKGLLVGEAVGVCSTKEAKYRFRKAEQTCPECGKPAIIKGKKEYAPKENGKVIAGYSGGGWLCYRKKGGCGATFVDDDPQVANQDMGRVEHDNPADYWNTVTKIAEKRAFVRAVNCATSAHEIFTEDIEDFPGAGDLVANEPPKEKPPVQQPQRKSATVAPATATEKTAQVAPNKPLTAPPLPQPAPARASVAPKPEPKPPVKPSAKAKPDNEDGLLVFTGKVEAVSKNTTGESARGPWVRVGVMVKIDGGDVWLNSMSSSSEIGDVARSLWKSGADAVICYREGTFRGATSLDVVEIHPASEEPPILQNESNAEVKDDLPF